MDFFIGIAEGILLDILDTLKAWVCWLLEVIGDAVVDFIIWGIDQLPENHIDPAALQEVANHVYMFNEVIPVVEFCGMFAMYLTWRVFWNSLKLVVWVVPSIGGGM